MTEATPPLEVQIDELDRRFDEVLEQIDQLDARLEAVIREQTTLVRPEGEERPSPEPASAAEPASEDSIAVAKAA